jgi:hypothetical protein
MIIFVVTQRDKFMDVFTDMVEAEAYILSIHKESYDWCYDWCIEEINVGPRVGLCAVGPRIL